VRKYLRFLAWTAIVVGIVVGAIRVLLLKTWVVPSDDKVLAASIAPSLAPGDVVLVLHSKEPHFGDLVRCIDPEEPRRYVIGRIGGESGDNVVVNGTMVIVNNRRSASETSCSERVVQIEEPTTGSLIDIHCDIEDLLGTAHMRGSRPSEYSGGQVEKTVPKGMFWLISDNRHYPLDSRTYGALPTESCDAIVVYRLWSAKGFGDADHRFTYIR